MNLLLAGHNLRSPVIIHWRHSRTYELLWNYTICTNVIDFFPLSSKVNWDYNFPKKDKITWGKIITWIDSYFNFVVWLSMSHFSMSSVSVLGTFKNIIVKWNFCFQKLMLLCIDDKRQAFLMRSLNIVIILYMLRQKIDDFKTARQ